MPAKRQNPLVVVNISDKINGRLMVKVKNVFKNFKPGLEKSNQCG